MSRLELVSYIQQNLKDGFSKKEIRNALFGAGWNDEEVDLAFQSLGRSRRRLLGAIAVIVLTPLLGFGSAWLYTNYQSSSQSPSPQGNEGRVSGVTTESAEKKQSRDQERLSAIAQLQGALEKYFQIHQLYPKSLNSLVEEGIMPAIPVDPKTNEPYLYNPLGDPPLYYSLSFVLEVGVGHLKKGFNNITSENKIESINN